MPLADDLYQQALQQHNAGNLAQAERLCRDIVRQAPLHADALHLLGVIAFHGRQFAQAASYFLQAVALRPQSPDFRNNLGLALHESGRSDEAVGHYLEALRLQPESAIIPNNLGNAYRQLGRIDEARTCYETSLGRDPDYAEALNNLGVVYKDQNRLDEAKSCYERALALKPEFAQAHNNLGVVLKDLGKVEEALVSYRRALELAPNYAEVWCNIGCVLQEQERNDEAAAHYERALQLNPALAKAASNLANIFLARGDFPRSEALCRDALRAQPDYPAAHCNLGAALEKQARSPEALASLEEAIRLQPDFPEARLNRAMVWLADGDYGRGWEEYEWRWRSKEIVPRSFPEPAWDGGPLDGRTILLHEEQGLGDTIQFVRYAALVKERGGVVILGCQQRLARLLATVPGVDRVVVNGDPMPRFDVHAPLMTLPRLFGTTPETIPARVPYLSAEPARVAQWQAELAAVPGYKVGVCWQGNPRNTRDTQRSIPLARFAGLARGEGVRLISLQKGPGAEQVAKAGFDVLDWGPRLDTGPDAFVDTAALMQGLDLVITIDTATVHLAGALGVPTWLALARAPDWRWLRTGEHTAWYPTVRLFRQERLGDWDGVLRRMEQALAETRRPTTPRPLYVEVGAGELVDKITILEIKHDRIRDTAKLANVDRELAALRAVRDRSLPPSAELDRLTAALRQANEKLWQIEDDIRGCEGRQDFGPHFIELARSVYQTNDHRAALKRQVNELVGARMMEEKSYAPAGGSPS